MAMKVICICLKENVKTDSLVSYVNTHLELSISWTDHILKLQLTAITQKKNVSFFISLLIKTSYDSATTSFVFNAKQFK